MAKEKLTRIEKLKARRKKLEEKGNSGGFDFFFIKEGTIRMRPLPVAEDEEIAMDIITFYLGSDIGRVISPATFGEPCAIMETYQELKDGDEDDKELASKFKPQTRYVQPHIRFKDLKGKEVDDEQGAKLLLLTSGQYQDNIDLFLDEENGDFTDPKEGYDLKYKRTGTGQFDTEYSVLPCRPTKLPKKYNKIYNIEEMVRAIMPTYDKTQEFIDKFLGVSSGDEEEAPKKKKKKVTSKDTPKKKKSTKVTTQKKKKTKK